MEKLGIQMMQEKSQAQAWNAGIFLVQFSKVLVNTRFKNIEEKGTTIQVAMCKLIKHWN